MHCADKLQKTLQWFYAGFEIILFRSNLKTEHQKWGLLMRENLDRQLRNLKVEETIIQLIAWLLVDVLSNLCRSRDVMISNKLQIQLPTWNDMKVVSPDRQACVHTGRGLAPWRCPASCSTCGSTCSWSSAGCPASTPCCRALQCSAWGRPCPDKVSWR